MTRLAVLGVGLVLLLGGCAGPELELVPSRVSRSAVVETEYRVEGLPLAALFISHGGTLERRTPEVWLGDQPAEVVSVEESWIRVRLVEGLPPGAHALRVRSGGEYERSGALTVDEEGAFDAGADASAFDGGRLDAAPPDAGAADAGVYDAGFDAAGSDAELGDSGALDAGPFDASSTDAGVFEPRGVCTGGSVGTRCECDPGDVCMMTCVDDCAVVCRPRSTCSVRLEDDGELLCQPNANCKLDAQLRTVLTCQPGSSCQSSFHQDATVYCPTDAELVDCCIIDCLGGCTGADRCE